MAELIRPNVTDGVRRSIGVAVCVAVEARHPLMRLQATPVVRQIELLLRERRDEQPQPLELLRVDVPL